MEKIIFFVLVIPIMAFVLYLGGMAIMNGFKSKEANRAEKEAEQFKDNENLTSQMRLIKFSSFIKIVDELW